ncbi:hypothetical protein X265_23405 [Bradyrhizobium guangdongense]|nr:hypothetical protein X265_23405 [Bradyrhizobium guangdongense]
MPEALEATLAKRIGANQPLWPGPIGVEDSECPTFMYDQAREISPSMKRQWLSDLCRDKPSSLAGPPLSATDGEQFDQIR